MYNEPTGGWIMAILATLLLYGRIDFQKRLKKFMKNSLKVLSF